jgi:hypothetical protein
MCTVSKEQPKTCAAARLADALPGEDRSWGGRALYIDLVPKSMWRANVRAIMTPADWRTLTTRIRARANDACEICGERGALDVHERWTYDELAGEHVQRLIRLIALCKLCHGVTHFGLAHERGQAEQMRAHLATVNRWTRAQVLAHEERALDRWDERSACTWTLDVSMIAGLGFALQINP